MIASITVRWLLPILSGGILVFAFPGWNAQIAVWLWLFPLLAVLWPVKATETHQKGSEGAPGSKKRTLWSSMVSLVRSLLRSGFAPAYVAGLAFFIPNLCFGSAIRLESCSGALETDSWAGWGPELLGYARGDRPGGLLRGVFWPVGMVCGDDSPGHASHHADSRCLVAEHAALAGMLVSRSGSLGGLRVAAQHDGVHGIRLEWLGVAFHRNLVLIQAADMVGVMGLSFLPVFVACTAWNSITRFYSTYHGQGTCRSRARLHAGFDPGARAPAVTAC
jgi:apolipoprotein N-acyltransferase